MNAPEPRAGTDSGARAGSAAGQAASPVFREGAFYVFQSRPVRAVVMALGLSLVPELVPGLASLRVWSTEESAEPRVVPQKEPTEVGEAELLEETEAEGAEISPAVQLARAPFAAPPKTEEERASDPSTPELALVDPSGRALNAFFEALDRTARKEPGAITRILHYGDSIVTGDYVSGTLRRRFQERFGDAGHGFTLIANAWPAYFHRDVERYATAGWKVSRITGPYAKDGLYGLGCVSFRAEPNALARFATKQGADYGGRASRFLVSYLEEPAGGDFEISVDGSSYAQVRTQGLETRARLYEVRVPDAHHSFEIVTKRGASRLFGVVLERDVPGVVLDAVGIQGARIRFLDKQDDAHFAEQLALRAPNLILYQFGANESGDGFLYKMEDYHATMKAVLEQARRAVPNASCLVIGAMDRAARRGDAIVSIRVLPHILEVQRKVASEVGCAFFDTFTAMGGAGSMPRWVQRGLGQADLTHPSGAGAERIGGWIYRAISKSYGEFSAGSPSSAAIRAPSSR